MKVLRNPIAIRDGKTILIRDLSKTERGKSCRCKCPACGGDFIARMGEYKVHHFAHSKEACDEIIAYTSGLYKLIQQVLSEGKRFFIPALVISDTIPKDRLIDESEVESFVSIVGKYPISHYTKLISNGKHVLFESIKLSFDGKNNIQAMELSVSGKTMAIKVMPPDTDCRFASVSPHKDMATLVLDFTDEVETIQESTSKVFEEYLFSEQLRKYWIFNPLTKNAFPELMEKNKKLYDEYVKQQTQLKEQRKADIEQKKQIDEERILAFAEQHKKREQDALESVKDRNFQLQEAIFDCNGLRWMKCEICGTKKPARSFSSFGIGKRINFGVCSVCRIRR